MFEKLTGKINLSAIGENAFIKRKNGKKEKIPSIEILKKLYNKFTESQSQEDSKKLREFQSSFPKVMEGDVFITGKDSIINISCEYNTGKEKPIEGYKNTITKNLILCGDGAQAKILDLENWKKEDKKTNTIILGTSIKGYEILTEGFFYSTYSNTQDELVTPFAKIKFEGKGATISIDFYKGVLYTVPILSSGVKNEHGKIEFILKKSKKSYKDESETIKEIIISENAIYKKSMIQMDPFDYTIGSKLFTMTNMTEMPNLKKEQIIGQPKKITETMKQAQISMEMFKNLSSSEITELGKSQGSSPEQIKQMLEGIESLKKMEKTIPFEEMNKGLAKMNAYYEGMGNSGVESMINVNKRTKKVIMEYNSNSKKEVLNMINSPRKYGPLNAEFKVV